MIFSSKSILPQRQSTRRRALILTAALVFFVGCGQTEPHVADPFLPPEEFSDEGITWQLVEGEPSQKDNQKIGAFFQKHPDLVGSPEWTGDTVKYDAQGSARIRFYWFSGNSENPSWNALEVNGSNAKQLSGIGSPDSELE